MTIFFHGNFGLNRRRMAEIMRLGISIPDLSDAKLAKPFDYGAPFATKYRYWLHKTGIIQLRRPFQLTEMGRIVWDHDPLLEHHVTQWFMHQELTFDPVRAEAWHFFMHEFRPAHATFSKNTLQEALMMKLRRHDETHFGPNSKMNPVIVRKLIECYTEREALGNLGIVCRKDDATYRFVQHKVRGPWKTPDKLVAAFANEKG